MCVITLHLFLQFGGLEVIQTVKVQKCQRETNAEGSARQAFVNLSLRCPFQNVQYGRRLKCPRWKLWGNGMEN